MNKLILILATGFNSGLLPYAPGTAGTFVGLILTWLLLHLGVAIDFPLVFIVIVLGVYVAQQGEDFYGEKDAPQIVIDEIAGFLVAMYGLGSNMLIPAFILFRIFDILKPYPINKLQEFHGGVGIMLDDIVAGVVANLLIKMIIFFA